MRELIKLTGMGTVAFLLVGGTAFARYHTGFAGGATSKEISVIVVAELKGEGKDRKKSVKKAITSPSTQSHGSGGGAGITGSKKSKSKMLNPQPEPPG